MLKEKNFGSRNSLYAYLVTFPENRNSQLIQPFLKLGMVQKSNLSRKPERSMIVTFPENRNGSEVQPFPKTGTVYDCNLSRK